MSDLERKQNRKPDSPNTMIIIMVVVVLCVFLNSLFKVLHLNKHFLSMLYLSITISATMLKQGKGPSRAVPGS